AFEAFGYKQLIFEPFFGGGLVTALAIPVIYLTGPWPLFAVMLAVFLVAVLVGLLYFGPREQKDRRDWEARGKPADHAGGSDAASTAWQAGRDSLATRRPRYLTLCPRSATSARCASTASSPTTSPGSPPSTRTGSPSPPARWTASSSPPATRAPSSPSSP